MAEETYYSLLEISENASAAEIKAAHRRLIREVHPDRLAADAPAYWRRQADEKSKEINEAYSVLSDHEKRRLYDSQLAAYRGSRNTTNRQTPSQTNTASNANSSRGRSQAGTAQQRSSGHSQHARSNSQQQTTPNSGPSASTTQQPQNPVASGLSAVERLLFALLGGLLAFIMAVGFWESESIGGEAVLFVLAILFLFGVACLYQRFISRTFSSLGIRRPQQQLGGVIFILVVLFGVKTSTINRETYNNTNPQSVAASNPRKLPEVLTAVAQANNLDADLLASVMDVEGRSDTDEARRLGTHLNELLVRYHDNIALSLAAYKEGTDAVDKYHGIPPNQETRAFVSRVIHEFNTRVRQREGLSPLPKDSEPVSAPASRQPSPQVNAQLSSDTAVTPPPKGLNRVTTTIAGDPSRSLPTPVPKWSASDRTSIQHSTTADSSRSQSVDPGLAPHLNESDLSRLSSVDRESIESACSGARLVQGAAAYHRCLNTQLEDLARYPDRPDLSRLSNVDRASIESACSGAKLVQGPAAYHQCLSTQLEELAGAPDTPDLSGLSSVDRDSIKSACSAARLVQGPAAYHKCLRNQLSALLGR